MAKIRPVSKRVYGTGSLFFRRNSWYFRPHGEKNEFVLIDPETGLKPKGKMEARKLADRLTTRINEGNLIPNKKNLNLSLKELDEKYLRAFPEKILPTTLSDRERAMKMFCNTFPLIKNINHESLEKWRSSRLKKEVKRGRRFGDGTSGLRRRLSLDYGEKRI